MAKALCHCGTVACRLDRQRASLADTQPELRIRVLRLVEFTLSYPER
jgi:hypothetical protein